MLFCATYSDYSGFGRSAKSVLGWHATEEVGGENGLRREHPAMRSILMPKSSMIGLWTKPVVYDRVVSKVLSKTYTYKLPKPAHPSPRAKDRAALGQNGSPMNGAIALRALVRTFRKIADYPEGKTEMRVS